VEPPGSSIRAVEYLNPDWSGDLTADLRHVVIEKAQVIQITPEEVISAAQFGSRYGDHRPAAMFDLGRSPWLESFAPDHLGRCRHIQMLFYDQMFDVICEGVRCGRGPASTDA
jgi:hypothetical protein